MSLFIYFSKKNYEVTGKNELGADIVLYYIVLKEDWC